jgi:acetyl esterase/lipase
VEEQTPSPCRSHFVRGLKIFGIGVFVSLIVVLATARTMLHANSGERNEPPAGYPSTQMIKLAFVTGQLKLVDVDLPVPDSIEFREGIEYGKGGDTSLKLDLHLPKDLKKPAPVLMFVHGGGWSKGKRSDYRYYCVKFAEQGYVVATISYRLRDVVLFPAAVEDTKCAVRWMRVNAVKLGGDPGSDRDDRRVRWRASGDDDRLFCR